MLRNSEKFKGTKSEAHLFAAVCFRLLGSPILPRTPGVEPHGTGLPPALSESSGVQGVTKAPLGSLGRSSRTKTLLNEPELPSETRACVTSVEIKTQMH